MIEFAPNQRVKHKDHLDWGIGEILDTKHPTGFCVFFEWAGERFTIRPTDLLIVQSNEAESRILDAVHIYGTSQANHSVYVIELNKTVWNIKSFRDENPDYQHKYPCVYVGMTGLEVEKRFENHKRGYKYNWFARYYGEKLLHELFVELNPRRYEVALATEFEFARKLRNEGYAVYQR